MLNSYSSSLTPFPFEFGETVSVYILRALLRGQTGLFSFLISSEFYSNIAQHRLHSLAYLATFNKLRRLYSLKWDNNSDGRIGGDGEERIAFYF
jgi:hypothetical protein